MRVVDKTAKGVLSYAIICIRRRSSVHHKVSGSYISRTRIIKFYRHIQHKLLYIYSGHMTPLPVGIYREKKLSKMTLPMAPGGISREWFKRCLQNSKELSRTIGLIQIPDMTSLAASSQLQDAIKYCIKVRRTGPYGKDSNSSAAA